MRSRHLLSLLFSFICLTAPAQPPADTAWVKTYARQVVDTLAAPGTHGRGYVQNGHQLAATYIAQQFKALGLQSIGNAYFQEFPISVNTFPGRVTLKAGKQKLAPGTEFLVAPCSNSLKGKYRTYYLAPAALTNPPQLLECLAEAEDKVLVVDETLYADSSEATRQTVAQSLEFLAGFKNNPAVALLKLTNGKLTWHVAQQSCSFPQITVSKAAWPATPEKVELTLEARLEPQLVTQNVIGLLPGTQSGAGTLLVSAHYDHLGRMGEEVYFPGANDNASGVAMLLSLARYFSTNPLPYSVLFVAFGAEEAGLLGSQYFVENPPVPLQSIRFMLNLDITGTGEEGIKVVNGKVLPEQFNTLSQINDQQKLLKQVSARGEACNSDHCLLYQAGVPAFFVYTLGGIQAYHDPLDRSETLPLTAFGAVHVLLRQFLATL